MRRVPLGSEAGAFRVTLGAGLVIGASVFIGWLTVPPVGVVVFAAATVSAALSRLRMAFRDRPAALRRAMSEAAMDRARPQAGHHVLVVANEALAGTELAELILQHRREHIEVHVLAPVLASHLHYAVSDIDGELAEAHARLERSLAWTREHKIAAHGEVGDPNPSTALEDELRTFGANEVIVVTHPRDRETWQERGELARLRRELDVPVTHVVVRRPSGRAADRSTLARTGPGDRHRSGQRCDDLSGVAVRRAADDCGVQHRTRPVRRTAPSAAEGYVLAAARTRTEIPRARPRPAVVPADA